MAADFLHYSERRSHFHQLGSAGMPQKVWRDGAADAGSWQKIGAGRKAVVGTSSLKQKEAQMAFREVHIVAGGAVPALLDCVLRLGLQVQADIHARGEGNGQSENDRSFHASNHYSSIAQTDCAGNLFGIS